MRVPTTNDNEFEVARVTMGRFPKSRISWWIDENATFQLNTLGFDGGALPVADAVVYCYAVPPPYPSGYADLAPREFFVGATVASDFFTLQSSGNQINCIVVQSEQVPRLTGPQGSATGDGTIYDWPFRSGATPATVDRDQWCYLGAYDFDQSAGAAMKQDWQGGQVIVQQRSPVQDFALAGNGNGTYDMRLPDNSGAAAEEQGRLPVTATVLSCVYQWTWNGTANVKHEMRIDDAETAGTATPAYKEVANVSTDTSTPTFSERVFVVLPGNGNVAFTGVPDPLTIGSSLIRPLSYVDAVIAQR